MSLALDKLGVTSDSQADWYRIIVSLRRSADLFAELVDDPADHAILVAHELNTKPFQSSPPLITRPFEEADIYDPIAAAIAWPFEHPSRSRYSNGSFGAWYGANSLLTAIYETAYHFRVNTLASAAAATDKPVVQERRAHLVACTAALIDLRPHLTQQPALLDPHDYSTCQLLGSQLHNAALPGVISRSVRHPEGYVIGVFRQEALTDPRTVCYLTYTLDVESGVVRVEREPGQVLTDIHF